MTVFNKKPDPTSAVIEVTISAEVMPYLQEMYAVMGDEGEKLNEFISRSMSTAVLTKFAQDKAAEAEKSMQSEMEARMKGTVSTIETELTALVNTL